MGARATGRGGELWVAAGPDAGTVVQWRVPRA